MASRPNEGSATVPQPPEPRTPQPRPRPSRLAQRLAATPWVVVSVLLHLQLLIALAFLAWREDEPPRPPVAAARLGPDEVAGPEEAELREEPLEPELDPAEVFEQAELVEEPWDDAVLDPEPLPERGEPAESSAAGPAVGPLESPLGLVGGGGGKFGARRHGAQEYTGSSGMATALAAGLEWLARHQSADGSWDADRFMHEGRHGDCGCDGPGARSADVGVSGLALLAFLGAGNTTADGPYRAAVGRGVRWLREQQDESGRFGAASGAFSLYNHAIATMVLCEAYHATRNPLLKRTAIDAVGFAQRARNPYLAWRYSAPPDGSNDTSVTGWMVFALATAADASLEIDPGALDGALAWIDRMTSEETGRTGYVSKGGGSIRGSGEAMTAVALLSRILIADARRKPLDDDQEEIVDAHRDVLLRALPLWRTSDGSCDMYYWYYGTYAMYQLGGNAWTSWERALERAVVRNQRDDGHERGSWDPDGVWGDDGGRVYATAALTLTMQASYRYTRLIR